MLPAVVGLGLVLLGSFAVLVLSRAVMRRLGLDPLATLFWLGLAERPNGEPRAQRTRLKELLTDATWASTS